MQDIGEETSIGSRAGKDITDDFLLCNRCGTCRSVCPLLPVFREEWAGARGKVELAEAFFRGEKIDGKQLQRIFDLCLHCMTCEENCPSGMRADEIVMAVRAEMARRGMIPRIKRIALRALEGMDSALFKMMRGMGLVRRAPLHGIGGKSPLGFLFPLFHWPKERFIPLPKDRPFLGNRPELFRARDLEVTIPDPGEVRRGAYDTGTAYEPEKAAALIELISAARERNLAEGRCAYFFIGHAVNHFFPEEADAVVRALNLIGVDVLAPREQVCCGAPVYYAGDIDGARRAAAAAIERFEGRRYDWIVTSCASGGLMLKKEFPRLFDLTSDGYFEIEWDAGAETFRRVPGQSNVKNEYPGAADRYREFVDGKVYDINELFTELLGLDAGWQGDIELAFGSVRGGGLDIGQHAASPNGRPDAVPNSNVDLPVVTYHQPCHLNRGQGVSRQPELILERLPGHRYVRMEDADRCCGGGGAFTFIHSRESEAVAQRKMDAVAKVSPDVLATSCPICRIQLMDMLHRRFVLGAKKRGERPRIIPVRTPIEMLLDDLAPVLLIGTEGGG